MVTKFNFYFLQPVVNKDWLLNCLKFRTWVSEKHFWVGKSQICTPDKPDHTTLEVPKEPEEEEQENVQESGDKTMENPDDSEEIVISRPKSRFTPGKSKSEISDNTNNSEAKNNDKIEDNDDEEIVIKRPVVKTPMNNVQRRLTIGKKIDFT